MEVINLEGVKRTELGKKATKLLRREEKIPCNLYGGEANVSFHAPYNMFRKLIYTDKFIRVNLQIDGSEYPAIVKDIQFHPVTDRIIHVDFQQLVDGKKVITEIPVKTEGFADGVQEGGKLQLKLRKVEVKGFPNDLPDTIVMDVTKLMLGKSLKVGDIELPGCEIMNNPGIPVVSVVVPRLLKTEEEEAAEAAEAAGAEGEGEEAAPAEGGEAPAEG